jgi:hypothetical protein
LSKSKAARLDPETIFAEKDEPLPPVAERAPARTVPIPAKAETPPAAPTPAPEPEKGTRKKEETIATTIAFPPVIMQRIQERLQQDQAHNLRTLVLYALSQIGIEIEPEYLKPTRRRWTR